MACASAGLGRVAAMRASPRMMTVFVRRPINKVLSFLLTSRLRSKAVGVAPRALAFGVFDGAMMDEAPAFRCAAQVGDVFAVVMYESGGRCGAAPRSVIRMNRRPVCEQ